MIRGIMRGRRGVSESLTPMVRRRGAELCGEREGRAGRAGPGPGADWDWPEPGLDSSHCSLLICD